MHSFRMAAVVYAIALGSIALGSACHQTTAEAPCIDNSNCDLTTGGVCVAASTGNSWCAYPDSNCDGGFRFSDESVGDGLSGTCVPGQPPGTFKLTIEVGGSGTGTITSSPDGISCSAGSCMGSFVEGTQVELSQTTATGKFLGWSDDCTGSNACSITMDADHAVGALFGIPGQVLWASQVGGDVPDEGTSVAVTSAGDLIAAGDYTSATVSVGGMMLTNPAGGADVYVARLDASDGHAIWAKSLASGTSSRVVFPKVVVGINDDIYVAGSFEGTVDFGGTSMTSTGGLDAFLVKFDANGVYQWSTKVGGTSNDQGLALGVNGTTVALGGIFLGTMNLGGTNVTSVGSTDIFVATYSDQGVAGWAKAFGGTSADSVGGIAVDASNNVVVSGTFLNTISFGGTALTSAGMADGYLAKLAAADGAHLFSRRFGATDQDVSYAITVDSANNMYVTGGFSGTVDFGGATPLVSGASGSIYVVKYTPAGSHIWSKAFSGTGQQSSNGLALNASGDLAMVGVFTGTLSLGGDSFSSVGSFHDVFVARLSGTDGSHLNSLRLGGTGEEGAAGIAESADGHFYATGSFGGFADFGGNAFTSAGLTDGFIVGIAPF